MTILGSAVLILGCRPRAERAPANQPAAPASRQATDTAVPQGNTSLDSTEFSAGYGLPHAGSWVPLKDYSADRFMIQYPGTASASQPPRMHSDDPVLLISELPECKWPCFVSVSIWRDSSRRGLAALVHDLMHPDTSGGNADAADDAATLLDSLPLAAHAAVNLELYCGDCTRHAIYTEADGWVAAIEYSLDDRDGYNPPLLRKLEGIARTFRWRSP